MTPYMKSWEIASWMMPTQENVYAKIFILFRKEEAQNGNDKGREYA